jgi:hypothetical protein
LSYLALQGDRLGNARNRRGHKVAVRHIQIQRQRVCW